MNNLIEKTEKLDIIKIGINAEKYASGYIYTTDGEKIPFDAQGYDESKYITSHPLAIRTYFYNDEKMMLEKPQAPNCEFKITSWLKGMYCSVGSPVCCKCEDGKLYYRYTEDVDWKEVIKSDKWGNCNSWIGSHNKIVYTLSHQYDDVLTSIANGLDKLYSDCVGYGKTYEITYKGDD